MRTCLQCGQETGDLHCPQDGMATVVQGVSPPTAVLPAGAIFAGRYRIVGVLGRGGMGTVYDAQHTGTGQAVAIKTLLLDDPTGNASDLTAIRRFFQEARITAGLQHPNTVRVFDFGQSDEGIYYLAMERLRGETLGEHLLRLEVEQRPMTQQEAGKMAIDVLRSLAEAHKAGLVHRDLKPANIYLHDLGTGEHVVKVLDFGIAKSSDAHLTRTGTSIGTPSYMSPEQVMSSTVDGRSDLYALGVILYGCVAGVLPFQADSSYSMMMKHVQETPPDLTGLKLPGVTRAFAEVVQKALAKSPADRFADAQSMREAVETALQTTQVPASGVTIPSGLPPTTHLPPPAHPPAPDPRKPVPAPRAKAPAPAPDSTDSGATTPTAPNRTPLIIVGVVAFLTAAAAFAAWQTMSTPDKPEAPAPSGTAEAASPDAKAADPVADPPGAAVPSPAPTPPAPTPPAPTPPAEPASTPDVQMAPADVQSPDVAPAPPPPLEAAKPAEAPKPDPSPAEAAKPAEPAEASAPPKPVPPKPVPPKPRPKPTQRAPSDNRAPGGRAPASERPQR